MVYSGPQRGETLNFYVGDLVQLKSGGAPMTIIDPRDYLKVKCSWFEDGKLKTGRFPGDALQPYQASTESATA